MVPPAEISVRDLAAHPRLALAAHALTPDMPGELRLAFNQPRASGRYLHAAKTLELPEAAYTHLMGFPDMIKACQSGHDVSSAFQVGMVWLHEHAHRLQFEAGLHRVWRTGANGPFLQYALVNALAEAQAECSVIERFYTALAVDAGRPNICAAAGRQDTVFRAMWAAYLDAVGQGGQMTARRQALKTWLQDRAIAGAFVPAAAQYLCRGRLRQPTRFPRLPQVALAQSPLLPVLDYFALGAADLPGIYRHLHRQLRRQLIRGLSCQRQKYLLRLFPRHWPASDPMLCISAPAD